MSRLKCSHVAVCALCLLQTTMKQCPGLELTVPQLVHALQLKLRRTVECEAYVSVFFSLDSNADENSARPTPLIQLEDVRQRQRLLARAQLIISVGFRTGSGSPLYSPGRPVVGEHIQPCEPSPSRDFVLDPDVSTPQTESSLFNQMVTSLSLLEEHIYQHPHSLDPFQLQGPR